MNVSELFDLTSWIDAEIAKPDIAAKYTALHAALQRYAQPNQQGTSFEGEKNQLIEAVSSVPLHALSKDQVTFLDSLGIAGAVGQHAADQIEDVLYRNVIDAATSATKIQEMVNSLNNGINKSKQIQTGLSECVSDEDYEIDGEVLMRVTFTGKAAMANVGDFKEWGKTWYEIGRGIAMAHGKTPDDVRIVGATRGSIVIELAVLSSIAATASFIILRGLKVAEKVLDLRMKAEDLRGMKLKNDKIAAELEKAAETEKTEGIAEITKDAAKTLKLTKAKNGEELVALERSVQGLLSFVEDGGEVDFVMPEENVEEGEEPSPELLELRSSFEEIRQLETKLALLEHNEDEEA